MKKFVRAIFTLLAAAMLLCMPSMVFADTSPLKNGVFRVAGATRFETAIFAADAQKDQNGGNKYNTIILASGKKFPDALAGSYLANQKNAPLIMVGDDSNTYLSYITQNLAPNGMVYILGGNTAVPANVEQQLASYTVKRLSGATRYETNLVILEEVGVASGDILVCTGRNFADALAASSVNKPILLVDGKTGRLSADQIAFLDRSSIEKFYIIGGENAVDKGLENILSEYGSVERIQGSNRYETAVEIARKFFSNPQTVVLAYSLDFPDGLSGGPLAASMDAPVLLAKTSSYSNAKEYVLENGITNGIILGGEKRINDATAKDIFSLSEGYVINSWEQAQSHTITYVLNGGENAPANPENYTPGQIFTLKEPTKSNYVFKGWYLESSFKTKVDRIDSTFNGDIKLYAKWNLEALNVNGYTTDNMIWSWWYYPQAISAVEDNDNLYWGYTTNDGYCGVARYDKASQVTTKTDLKHADKVDDHNGLALTIMKDGRIMCVYSGGHNSDNEVHIRISDKPYDITNFSTDIVLMSVGKTCYGQILQHNGEYYIFYRVNNNRWASRQSSDGMNWSDETIVVSSNLQYYCRFMPTTQPGLVRICMCSNPTAEDPRIRMGFLDLESGKIYNADNVTVLGTDNITYDRFDVLITPPENYVQRMLDVAITAPDSPQILVATFKNNRNDKDSVYSLYKDGTMTEICHGGNPLWNPKYQLGAAFAGDNRIVAICNENDSDIVRLYNISENQVVLADAIYTEEISSENIRNGRPIVDVNGKAFLWHRGYYNPDKYTDFNTDARLYYFDGSARVGLDPSALSVSKPENVAVVQQYAIDTYNANIMDNYLTGPFTWDVKKRVNSWIYFTGLMHEAFLETDFDAFYPEIKNFYDQHISDDGQIARYINGELDAAYLGVPMIRLLRSDVLTAEEHTKYNAAANYIYHQLEKQTIYPQAGNLWLHSQNADGTPRTAWTKWNICLDGVFMSQTFLVRLAEAIDAGEAVVVDSSGATVTSEKLWSDIYSRLVFIMENLRDDETGLIYHGYNVAEGITNKGFWSRGIGWYSMALLDACEKCPDTKMRSSLVNYYGQLMDALIQAQDPATFLWYNVTDGKEELFCNKKTENGTVTIYNIPETSGSAMFSYCLLKGYHCGLLQGEIYRTRGLMAFNALVETRLTDEGLLGVLDSSSVTTNIKNYQISGYIANDGKGAGPFILAAGYAH